MGFWGDGEYSGQRNQRVRFSDDKNVDVDDDDVSCHADVGDDVDVDDDADVGEVNDDVDVGGEDDGNNDLDVNDDVDVDDEVGVGEDSLCSPVHQQLSLLPSVPLHL